MFRTPLVIPLLLLLCLVPCAFSEAHRKILVLYDEDRDLPGLSLIDQSLKARLKAGWPEHLDFYTESLDLVRFADDSYAERLSHYYKQKYAGKKLDLIVAVMGPSLDFVLRYGEETFGATPIVFCGVDKRELKGHELKPRVTGVFLRRELRPTVDLALTLQPDTRRIVFIGGTSDFDRYWEAQARREFHGLEDHIEFRYLTDLSLKDTLSAITQLPAQTIILYFSMFRDGEERRWNHTKLQRSFRERRMPQFMVSTTCFWAGGW
jgi:hypothetical protein